jgi:methyl-accepting chemotaxis protein
MLRLPQRSGADLLATWRLQQQTRADERRLEPRRPVHILALMNAGGVECKCTILDLSASGARIAVACPKTLPGHVLVRIRGLIRRCNVIWRSDCEIGVEFLP